VTVSRVSVAVALAAVAMTAVAGAAAEPKPPPPTVGKIAPPPAWVATPRGDFWLAYGSYCWSATNPDGTGAGVCADMIAPEQRRDLPRLVIRRGRMVRFHLGFDPTDLTLTVGRRTYRLQPARVAKWRVRGRSGVVTLFARPVGGGDASYHARFVIRPR
jgi:hypothetical protein